MMGRLRSCLAAGTLLAASLLAETAFAQKPGGILQMPGFASPASMSIHEESTIAAGIPLMGEFNNLVVFDQHVAQNSLASIVPDLASDWSWDEVGTALTFRLHQGVKWHDGNPFTAADVKCTWDALAGKAAEKFRVNPRKSWYRNLDEITTNGDYEVTFHLKRPQPYLIALLASGQSPVYPCHVPLRDMRTHPIGTGPFKFVEYKPNEHIRVVRNPDYWKPGRPYLDGIETTIIPSVSTRLLAFVAGNFDTIQLSIPQLKDLHAQAPQVRWRRRGGRGRRSRHGRCSRRLVLQKHGIAGQRRDSVARGDEALRGRRRFIYEEFLLLQLGLALRRREIRDRGKAPVLPCGPVIDMRIRRLFPFTLTGDQDRAVAEVCRDLAGDRLTRVVEGLLREPGVGQHRVAAHADHVAAVGNPRDRQWLGHGGLLRCAL